MSDMLLIVEREFNERVRKKSFIVTTLLMPLLMIGLMLAPALMMSYVAGDAKTIVVIDRSGVVAPQLTDTESVHFERSDIPVDTARRVMTDKFGVLAIGADILADPSDVQLYTNAASSMMLEEEVRGQIAGILEKEKLQSYRIENLDRILAAPHGLLVHTGIGQRDLHVVHPRPAVLRHPYRHPQCTPLISGQPPETVTQRPQRIRIKSGTVAQHVRIILQQRHPIGHGHHLPHLHRQFS